MLLLASLSEVFMNMDDEQRFSLIVIAMGCLTGIIIATVSVLSGVLYHSFRRKREDQLKRDMLDLGMSAEEIATVVKATPPTDFLERMADRKKHASQ